ncbi:calcium-binding protein [Planctomycetes bacterium K23_9]|uniref:Hemolysin, chromosomal n=1 Tax=Stieleria marina TaxID=1930275 RepID=A0A517NXR3_9BACT|nr:Hemolysin, chromosomal [Planctomycetes bacterium K23_9]
MSQSIKTTNASDKRTSRRRVNRSLRIQNLAARQLMAADIELIGDTLQINGDDLDDQITVRYVNLPMKNVNPNLSPVIQFQQSQRLQVRVSDSTKNMVQVRHFLPSEVDDLVINTGNGANFVDNQTDLESRIVGGDGPDRLYGGSVNDRIFGGDSRDYLFGRDGDDQINGQDGADYLYGGRGDDLLRGGNQRDRLYGHRGDDRLIGGNHLDYLYGGDDNDALIGGNGPDQLHSGTGDDRFLIGVGDNDTVLDINAVDDVRINFQDTFVSTDVNLASNIGTVTAAPATWNDTDLESVDRSLEMLFDATDNNRLLQKHDGSELDFVRYSTLSDSSGALNTSVLGWNGGDGIIILDNATWQASRLYQTVIHEVGHNFDTTEENAFVDEFLDVGTWTYRKWYQRESALIANGYVQAVDTNYDRWFFKADSADKFAREYGTMNPKEDFATSIAAKIMTDNGWRYNSESPSEVRTRMSARFDVLDDFFASLS